MKQLLFVDGTVSPERSRTRRLGMALLKRLEGRCQVETLRLETDGPAPMDGKAVDARTALCQKRDFDHPMFRYARQFRSADAIVLAAPYWDLSFPAMVKAYLEHVSVSGLTFRYGEDGRPIGLCRAGRLVYVTTAGGYIGGFDFGFSYVQGLAALFGIPAVERLTCEGLDIVGNDVQALMAQAIKRVDELEICQNF